MAEPQAPASSFAAQLAALSAQFAAQLGGRLDELECQLQGQGPDAPRELLETLHGQLHKLAGSGTTFGFPELSTQARALEVTAKNWLENGHAVAPEQWQAWVAGVQALRLTGASQGAEETSLLELPQETHEPRIKGEISVALVHSDSHFSEDMYRGLGQFGYVITPFSDLASAQTWLLHTPPDVLLLEMKDQEDANRQLAEVVEVLFNQLGHRLATIFLAPHAEFSIQLAAARAGAESCLALPVDAPTVAARIELLMRESQQPPVRVLIVDDDEALAEHYRLTLAAAGMLAERVSQPAEVMPALNSLHPDVLLMDLYMPECSGAELARAIRYDENWQGLPIIFLSAETDFKLQIQAIGSGADDFLVKPIPDVQLVSGVRARALRARKLAELMSQDSLTGLLKHASIKDRLVQEVERASRHGKPVSVAMVDIDFFKRVNDNWGHPMGDQVIKTLGHLLRQRLRRQDSVGRYGGEEFLAILPECTAADAQRLLDDIRNRFADITFTSRGQSFTVSISAGIASSELFRAEQDLLAAADMALYKAKHGGRSQVCIASEEERSV